MNGNAKDIEKFKTYSLNLPSLGGELADLWSQQDLEILNKPDVKPKGRAVIGMDLSLVNDLTTLAFYYEDVGKVSLYCFVPGKEELSYYESKYEYPFTKLHDSGHCFKTVGSQISFKEVQQFIVKKLAETNQTPGTTIILCDRYRMSAWNEDLRRQDLVAGVNFPMLVAVEQSSVRMETYINRFRTKIQAEELRFDGIEMLYAACLQAVLKRDSNGNKHFDRSNTQNARIDILISTLLAVSGLFYCENFLDKKVWAEMQACLLYTSPSPRD